MTILEAASALRKKEVSSLDLTVESLNRIAQQNPKLNAFLTVLDEQARLRANQADKERSAGIDRGPLHGIPIAVKDVFYMRGIRTTGGSKLFADFVPDFDATVVEKLQAAGAVIVGKTGLHELAFGVTSNNPHFGAVRNPWNLERIPGGSSGGSGSAVGAHLVFMATGNDTGGSVRVPASYCGTVGIKPTFGRISRYGILPLDFSLDHAGILTRTVRDTAVTLNVLAGHDSRDDTCSPEGVEDYSIPPEVSIRDVRIGWPESLNSEEVDVEVAQSITRMVRVAERLGARLVPIFLPDRDAINAVHRVILHSEVSALMQPHLGQRDKFSSDLLALLQQGCLLSATDYVNAQRLRRLMMREWSEACAQVDCVITPTTPIAAPRIGKSTVLVGGEERDLRLATTNLVRAANLLGLPAISIPCGFNREGLPLGLQITGKPFEEGRILRVAAALEDATDFHRRLPPILS
jgi:aspartyl-tRNA(Asn)/glutamyl-tRNA(Gln) amidotransferase subunit A